MKNYVLPIRTPQKYPKIDGWDDDIVETAGFVPLEVRFKQMEQAGIRAQFHESEFTSRDMSDMYLNHPEFDLTPEDDIEEAMEKIALREAWINQVKMEARKRNEEEATVAAASEKKAASKSADDEDEKNG